MPPEIKAIFLLGTVCIAILGLWKYPQKTLPIAIAAIFGAVWGFQYIIPVFWGGATVAIIKDSEWCRKLYAKGGADSTAIIIFATIGFALFAKFIWWGFIRPTELPIITGGTVEAEQFQSASYTR